MNRDQCEGLDCVHVDDFLCSGTEKIEEVVRKTIRVKFVEEKMESVSILFTSLKIATEVIAKAFH